MKENVKVVVSVTIGPPGSRNNFDDMADTVRSVVHYAGPNRKIIILDHSHPLNFGQRLKDKFPEVDVVRPPRNFGLYGGLYKAESYMLQHAYERYQFDILIRMDSDALLIGAGLADDALAKLQAHPNAGILGAYLDAGEGIAWAREQILAQTSVTGFVRDSRRCALLRQLVYKAERHAWQLGQHVLGGALIFTYPYVERVNKAGLLHREELRRAKLQNDHLFSLLAKACGLDLVNFNAPHGPLAVVWRGMPAAPADLVDQGTKLIHSTRFWQNMDEAQIRTFFRARRESGR